ncbi:MAG: AgmX/PglI C-terminal domain-containing protein [Deltaproteobacteria bacterium]|nr:AgmX/PglI C-terminal domain-containing protein [Deltaproteobacteria bacterium]
MEPGAWRSSIAVGLLLVLAACGGESLPPAPTVGTADVIRGGFTVSRGDDPRTVRGSIRVERGATVTTAADGRGAVRLDGGAWVLFDRGTEAVVGLTKIALRKGCVWIDTSNADETTIETPRGSLAASGATFAVAIAGDATNVYCGSGEVTFRSPRGSGRLEQGESVRLATSGTPEPEPEAMWDDWTGGLADPTPRPVGVPTAVGVLAGRRLGETGVARTPLPVRAHEVRASIQGDLATTDVTQTFFNARSDTLEAEYVVRLPETAVVRTFAVDIGNGFIEARVSSLGTSSGYELVWQDPSSPTSSLTYDGPGRLRARLYPVAAGATVKVRIAYTEWLEREGDMRTYVYRMGSGTEPPLVGEFVLDVDTRNARAGALRAGMGAELATGGRVVLRRSDFKPRADFYLDLIDPREREGGDRASAYVVQAQAATAAGAPAEGREQFALFDLPTAATDDDDDEQAGPPLELVVLLDVSGGTDPEDLELSRAVVESVLRQLAPTDRIAIRLADMRARPPASGLAALQPATDQTREAILESITRVGLGGATDLGRSLRDAAALVRGKPRGAVLYVGDGIPTAGALDATAIRAALATVDSPPRYFALAVGDGANADLLTALFGAGAMAVRERTEASRAVMQLLAEAARPTLRGVTVDLGPTVERVYPRGPLVLPDGRSIRVVGRLRGRLPQTAVVRGFRDGRPFTTRIKVQPGQLADGGDIRRRWATARLAELLDEDAGREALVELGVRFEVLTPWTPFVVGGSMGQTIGCVRGFDRDPLEVAWGLGGGSSGLPASTLGGETDGWRRRARSLAPEPDMTPESAWLAHATDPMAEDAALAGDGGLSQVAVQRALASGSRGPRGCYERRLVVRPDLSGAVSIAVAVEGNGAVRTATIASSTLYDPDVDQCVLNEVRGLRFPATGGPLVTVSHTYTFEMPTRAIGVRQTCSEASRFSLDVRRSLWRERLSANPGVVGALAVWREALGQCELGSWRARRTLADQIMKSLGSLGERIAVFRALSADEGLASYLVRALLRTVRSPSDAALVRNALDLEPQVNWRVFARAWNAQPAPTARLALVRRWLSVIPKDMDLRLRLLALLEETRAFPEARRLAHELRGDSLADARVRTKVGEFWLRQENEDEARRVFSEIVETAPLDPWARRRLGDLYRAHGWSQDAYGEYTTLARLRPDDPGVLLLLSRAAADAGRIDEALRLEQRLSESVESGSFEGAAAFARLWTSVRLARLKLDARDAATRAAVARRERDTGALRDPPALWAALTWPHPDDAPQLLVKYPGTPADVGFERVPLRGAPWGIEAIAVRERETGAYLLEVQRRERDELRDITAELVVVQSPATPQERIQRLPVTLSRQTRALRFEVAADGTVRNVPTTNPRPTRAELEPPREEEP